MSADRELEAESARVEAMRLQLKELCIRPNARGEIAEKQAALYLGCALRTMYNMRQRGDGPRYVHLFGRYWYPIDGLAEYVAIRFTDAA